MPPPATAGRCRRGSSRDTPLSRKRRILVWTLVVLASMLALVSILTTWVNRQMLDNTAWNKATTQVIQDPQVQSALADYTVNQLYENVDVAPGAAAAAAAEPPAARPDARRRARAAGDARPWRFSSSAPASSRLFINASAVAHQKLVNVLENKTGYGISTGNGVVTLNLHELVVELGTELGLPPDALAKLPSEGRDGHADEVRPALGGADRRPGHTRAERLAARRRARALRARDLPRARGRRATLRNAGFGLALVGLLDPRDPAACSATTSSTRSRPRATSRPRTGCA